MSRYSIFETYEPVNTVQYQTLEMTFRLLRNNNPLLAFLIKNALTEMKLKGREKYAGSYSENVFAEDLMEFLGPLHIIQIVGNLNEMGREALLKKDMPPSHLKMLRELIEEWAKVAEWILENATFDQTSYH